jgi:chorismate synthase
VVAGSIARQIIPQVEIHAFTSTIGDITIDKPYQKTDFSLIEKSPVRCPDPNTSDKMIALIEKIRKEGDSIGGKITCVIRGFPRVGENLYSINYKHS